MGMIQNKVTVSQPVSHVIVNDAGGLRGLTGEQGPQGPQGIQGPQGEQGIQGPQGIPGVDGKDGKDGQDGAAATITVGSTSTLPAGSSATVTNSGTSSAAVFDFGIPKGDKGDTGATGADGYSPTATVTKSGDTATITITDKNGTTTASVSDGTTPTVNDGTLTIQKNGTTVQTFSADQASNVTANITVPTQFSDLSGEVSSAQIEDEAITTGSATATGTNITLAGTMDGGAIDSVEMYGDTTQQTYSGKNLFQVRKTTQTLNNVTFTYNGDGTFNISASTPASTGTEFSIIVPLSESGIVSGQKYTLSSDKPVGTASDSISYWVHSCDSGGTWVKSLLGFTSAGTQTAQEPTTQYVKFVVNVRAGFSSSYTNVKTQMELGNQTTSFEPYVGGTASPNPDYPQNVNVVTGEQSVQVNGKNWYLWTPSASTQQGLMSTYDSTTGMVNVSGTSSASWSDIAQNFVARIPAGRYTLSVTKPLPFSITLRWTKDDGSYYDRSLAAGQTSVTYNNLEPCKRVRVFLGTTSGTTYDETFGFMLEQGSSATTYEPYEGVTKTVNLGKNLLDKSLASASVEGYFNNYNVSLTNTTRMAYIPCQPNTTYTVSKIASKRFAVATTTVVPDANVLVSGYINDHTGTSITITTSSTAKYLCVFYYLSTTDTLTPQEILDSLQIEKGSVATTYAPYYTPIELCKIGNYKDAIFKNEPTSDYYNSSLDDGAWYLHKEISKVLLDGTQYVTQYATATANKYRFTCSVYGAADVSADVIVNMSDKFVGVTRGDTWNNMNGVYQLSGRIGFYWDTIAEYTREQVVTWLSTNSFTAYYPLATPTDTKITNATLISELDSLLSATTYDNNTYITVSGDLASPLKVVAEADSKLAPNSVYGASIKDGAVSVSKIADLKALADALSPYLS